MSNINYCTIDNSKKGMNCDNNIEISKYSEDVKSMSDFVACTTTNSSATNSSATNSSATNSNSSATNSISSATNTINNTVVNANWSCTDRASCALGKRKD